MSDESACRIDLVRTADDLAAAIGLIRADAATLEIDLAYQGFEAELQAMPGAYAPPRGALLLARPCHGTPMGCVGLRPITADGRAEMKRLFVAEEARGCGLGQRLALAAIAAAERIGYREIVLDTLPSMTGAQALYRRLGFEVIDPYYETPIEGTIFMRLALGPFGGRAVQTARSMVLETIVQTGDDGAGGRGRTSDTGGVNAVLYR